MILYTPIHVDLQAKLALLNNIPDELRRLNQWCCWKYEDIGALKPTKVPYNPVTRQHASTTNPQTWCSYDGAITGYSSGNYDGIGFIFTIESGYSFIDLDYTNNDAIALDRQIKIFREFDSYSEISPSGQGLHIIVKGNVPVGRKRSFIEIYSDGRYATFTGNVHHNVPIKDCQDKLIQLWEQMGASIPQTMMFTGDDKEKHSDQEIIKIATDAENGTKFTELHKGNWTTYYPSQSEADLALVNIIAYYTQNRNQIGRIFRNSGLGQRDKAKRQDYLGWMINKSFDQMLPPIDFDGFKNSLTAAIEEIKSGNSNVAQLVEHRLLKPKVEGSTPSIAAKLPTLPPGLLGEIASFIYAASPRPVAEIALAGAIGLMAGISGRAYNVSSTGLNQYVLLLAATGSGKESIASGISKLISIVKQQVPTAPFFIGPSEIASGQALFKYISTTSQCFVSVLGEFGLRMLQLSNQNANGAEVSLRRMILDLYNKSGFKDVANPSIYADKDKNVAGIQSPSFTICGESTPERFYNNLNEDMISEGLLPRFLLIEYNGPRVPFNENHANAQPPFALIEKLTTLCANAETIQQANPRRVVDVKFTAQAMQISKSYDVHCDRQINNTSKDVIKHLWNRAHVKSLKLAALIAVGVNMYDPVIEAEYLNWAMNMVNNDIEMLTKKFEEGTIGTNTVEIRQIEMITNVIKDYVMSDWETVQKYADKSEKGRLLHTEKVVSYAFLSRRLVAQSPFRLDKMGATFAIKRCLQIMMDRDYLRELSKQELSVKFGTTQRAFIISNSDILK